jgi:hypothetical protein
VKGSGYSLAGKVLWVYRNRMADFYLWNKGTIEYNRKTEEKGIKKLLKEKLCKLCEIQICWPRRSSHWDCRSCCLGFFVGNSFVHRTRPTVSPAWKCPWFQSRLRAQLFATSALIPDLHQPSINLPYFLSPHITIFQLSPSQFIWRLSHKPPALTSESNQNRLL